MAHRIFWYLVIVSMGFCACRSVHQPLSFTLDDLHLDDVDDVNLITPSLLVKRASDAIVFKDDDSQEPAYQFSYKTDTHERQEKGYLINNELSVVGAYTVHHPNGVTQMTMYVADKNGYRPQIELRIDANLLKSAVG